MDQVKEILRQAVKYRFWIAVGISALLPLIAYFVAAGSLAAETQAETAKIEGAAKGVQEFKNGVLPNPTYTKLTDERVDVLTKDVDGAWRKLYARQAPLLTWPPEVTDRFQQWGEQWPKGVDQVQIQNAINDWVQVYPAYVTSVYKSFRPFDYETGTGVVAAPSEQDLLHPIEYTVDSPPSLGKVWAAQKKLWIEGVVLEVVDRVNKDAEDWDSAVIKEVQVLEVANFLAQDQRSIAKGETLEQAPEIKNPDAKAAPAAATTAAADSSKLGSMFGGGMGSAASQEGSDEVYVLKSKTPSIQFDTIPVHLSVLIDQSRIPDLIVGFQNSPMAIQVLDFEMNVPAAPVKKPAVGDQRPMGMGGMMGMMGGMGGMMGMQAMMGGSSMQSMQSMMNMQNRQMSSMQSMQGMQMSGMPGMPGMLGGAAEKRKGTDVSKEKLDAIRKAERKAKSAGKEEEKDEPESLAPKKAANPYYNIIEVRVYGQARFYKAPPPLPATPESAASPGAAAPADGTGTAPSATDAPKAEAPATATDAPKAEAPAAEAETPAAPKADAPAGTDVPATKGESPAEVPAAAGAPPAADTKDEAKADEPAAGAPPAEEAKDAAPKADAAPAAPRR